MARRTTVAIAAATVVLFLWHGLAQLFPWGVASVSNFSSTTHDTYVSSSSALVEAPPGTWTTAAFDERFGGRISTLATDQTFSWIMSVPREHYSLPRYFVCHAITQAVVSIFLLLVCRLLAPLPPRSRVLTVASLGAAAAIAVYGGMMNWLGMPAAYGVGQSVNLVIGWLLAFLVINGLVTNPDAHPAVPERRVVM